MVVTGYNSGYTTPAGMFAVASGSGATNQGYAIFARQVQAGDGKTWQSASSGGTNAYNNGLYEFSGCSGISNISVNNGSPTGSTGTTVTEFVWTSKSEVAVVTFEHDVANVLTLSVNSSIQSTQTYPATFNHLAVGCVVLPNSFTNIVANASAVSTPECVTVVLRSS
jgi:hypothetical protein